jgi:hypothetical protein
MVFIVSLGIRRPLPFVGVQIAWPLVINYSGNHITALRRRVYLLMNMNINIWTL